MAIFDVRCERCGEEGSPRRMDLKNGICFYCREERKMVNHNFGGPPTDGAQHCFKCGAIRQPDGKVIPCTAPRPSWAKKADCEKVA